MKRLRLVLDFLKATLFRASSLLTSVTGVTAFLTAAVVAVVTVLFAWTQFPVWVNELAFRDTFGKILVESPEIYTRERLVNDRLGQAVRLENQMRATEEVLSQGYFQSIEGEWRHDATTSAAIMYRSLERNGNTDKGDSADSASPASNAEPNKVKLRPASGDTATIPATSPRRRESTLALFHAMNEYREHVRTELMQTILDDRHDIDGNTLYRLNFNTTIVHGRRSDALAIVRVKLRHDEPSTNVPDPYYADILRDWMRELERRLNAAAENRFRLLSGEGEEERDSAEFHSWLRWKICVKLQQIARMPRYAQRIRQPIARGQETRFEIPVETIGVVSLFHQANCGEKYYVTQDSSIAFWRHAVDQIIADHVNRYNISAKAQIRLPGYLEFRHNQIPAGEPIPKHALPDMYRALEEKWCDRASFQMVGVERYIEGKGPSEREKGERALVQDQCNFMLTVQHQNLAISAIIELYWYLEELEKLLKDRDGEGTLSELARKFTLDNRPADLLFDLIGCKEPVEDLVKSIVENDSSDEDGLDDRIAEAEAIKRMLEQHDGLVCMIDERPWLWRRNLAVKQQVDQFNREFVDATIVGSGQGTELAEPSGGTGILDGIVSVTASGCDAGWCRIAVRSAGDLADAARRFSGKLKENFEAFSYGVTPKNLRQRLAFDSSAVRNLAVALEVPMLSEVEKRGFFENFRQRQDTLRSVMRQPLVTGFGRGRMSESLQVPTEETLQVPAEEDTLSKGTEFGWIVAPERQWNENPSNWHPHRQFDLSAVISIPSWWRKVRLTVSTCWQPLSDLDDFGGHYVDVCGDEGGDGAQKKRGNSEYGYSIKVPGDIREVSRKLRIEVRDAPYLLNEMYELDQGMYFFDVGKRADIVIEGGRLWRSTRVTLGTQTADKIIVLPHMDGIVATFDCVQRPPYPPVSVNDRSGAVVYSSKVQVWTSEGVTVPHLPVGIVAFDKRDDKSNGGQSPDCWPKDQ